MAKSFNSRPVRAATTLIALCFVTVMGYALFSYVQLCSRAMNLSNRTFHANLSKQLAEMGIDEALRAFNKGDWSGWAANPADVTGGTTAWTLDTTNKRASRTITFSSPKFGQGVSATVKIRVDNYDANQLDSTWSSTANYLPDNIVGYTDGNWYRCIASNTNKTPSTTTSATAYWIQEHNSISAAMTWTSGTSYVVGNMVLRNASWYRCKTLHTASSSNEPSAGASWTTYWVATPYVSADADLRYNNDAIVRYYVTTYGNDYWFRYNSGSWSQITDGSWALTWRWTTSTSYAVGAIISYNNVWYRCKTAHVSGATFSATNWDTASTLATTAAAAWAWSSTENYNPNDVVYRSSAWYRCIKANSNQAPPNSTYWSTSPRLSQTWVPGRIYSQNDSVRYNGVWYRYINGTSTSGNLPTNTSYWIGTDTATSSYQWNASTAYAVGDFKCYGGVWYKCIAATTANANHTPNNTAYWTPTWTDSWNVTTGTPVVYAEGTVTITGYPSVRTQLRATIAPAPLFPNAVGAASTISVNSGGTVDSYDSSTGTYASQVGTATNYSAVVAAGDTTGTAVSLSSTAVKGYVAASSGASSPFAPLIAIGGSASVKGQSSPASPNVDTSRVSRSPVIPRFDTLPINSSGGGGGLAANWTTTPKGTALTLSATTTIGTPGATTPARYYYNGDLTIGNATIANLRIIGPVILYINGYLSITSSSGPILGRIDIASTGSAEIHLAGEFRADAGGEGIKNDTANPKSLIIISDTTSTSSQYYSEGVNDLYGVIYMPYSTSNTGYFNDNNNAEIFGAISANKITYSGANMNVHYDTSLRYATFGGVDQPYTVDQWRELPGTELATMP